MASPKTKAADEIYCHSCGEPIKKEAEICVKCGVRVKGADANAMAVPKDKTVAILLAVFLSLFTWLYTYKRDAWKFWVNFGLSIVTFGFWGFIAWPWAIIDAAAKPQEYYKKFPNYRPNTN